MVNCDLKKKNNKKITVPKDYTFRTMGGVEKQGGIVILKLKIFEIEKIILFFVVKQNMFRFDLLLGLDCILEFRLCQDHKLKVTQYNNNKQHTIKEEKEIEINWNEFLPIEEFHVKTAHLSNNQKDEI